MMLFSSLVTFGILLSKSTLCWSLKVKYRDRIPEIHSLQGETNQTYGSYTTNREAEVLCTDYKKTCPEGKVCRVQHVTWPKNMTFPVCVSVGLTKAKAKLCELPPSPGKCGGAQHRRWYYNMHSSSCAWFYYTGCRGNANNFRTKTQCERKCVLQSKLAQLVELPPLVVMAPEEKTLTPKSYISFRVRRVSKGGKIKGHRKNPHRRKNENRRERRRQKEEQRRLRRMKRKHRLRANRQKPLIEDNLTVDSSSMSDQASHHIHTKSGQTRRIKLFSILDKYPKYVQS
ncbi:hypothetical protein ScPMuIL_012063 [Solemya velum]